MRDAARVRPPGIPATWRRAGPVGLTRGVTGPDADGGSFDAEFPTVDRQQWLDAVRGVLLRGRVDASDGASDDPEAADRAFAEAFARQLVTLTDDGIELQPLYDAADVPDHVAPPGAAPYVRSTHAAPRPWEIRQRVWSDVDGSTGVIELESGATGVLVELGADLAHDVDGIRSRLERVLDGVHLDLAPVSLAASPGSDGSAGATALLDLWEQRGIPAAERRGTLGVDPVGAWARSGGATDLTGSFRSAADVVGRAGDAAPSARVVVADGTLWHDAGATDGQELAWTIAAAVLLVRRLSEAGVDPDRAFSAIEFRWAATADQFATITKLRAARRLWARVAELSGVGATASRMSQHADGSRAMLTRYDPWVNALRSTVACFSAVMGGADAITVSPHDLLLEHGGTAFGRRIARNTQTILQLESHLARVVDPAGGSWYVEHRTADLAAVAWSSLQEVEALGGLDDAVRDGHVHRALAAARDRRERAVATRRRVLTGSSEYPNIDETPPGPRPVPVPGDPAPGHDLGDHAVGATAFEPLRLRRLAEPFERQRGRSDAHALEHGERPTVFLAAIGGPAASTARVTFAKSAFESGGIRAVVGEPSEFDPAITSVVCLCSSDAVYAEQGAQAAAQLREAGATKIFLAGRRLNVDGVDEEVGAGSDVLDVVTRTLDHLGVPA